MNKQEKPPQFKKEIPLLTTEEEKELLQLEREESIWEYFFASPEKKAKIDAKLEKLSPDELEQRKKRLMELRKRAGLTKGSVWEEFGEKK